jgi:uncharacterized protein
MSNPSAMTNPSVQAPAPAAAARPVVCLLAADPADAAAVAMARRGILICRAGQPVARVVEVASNAAGYASGTAPAELRVGQFVEWDDKSAAYVARKAGHAWLQRGRLEVEDTLELADDIDGATGAIQFEGPLTLHRNILDSASVRAAGTITVHGTIEAAEVHAGGDLHVHHGICGKEKGVASAQGRVTARFITNARVTSGGDMLIANEVVNSYLTCGGLLKVDQGTILAGHAISLGGISCHTAGSDAGARTVLEAGLAAECYDAVQKTVAAAETSLQKVQEIRKIVEPLMRHAKSLTPAQKEKATELLFAADEAEARANKDMAAVAQSKATLRTCLGTRILVSSLLHPGVIIRYPVAEAVVDARWRGPVEIALQLQGSEAHVMVIDRCRNITKPLPVVPNAEARMEFVRRFLAGPAPTL